MIKRLLAAVIMGTACAIVGVLFQLPLWAVGVMGFISGIFASRL